MTHRFRATDFWEKKTTILRTMHIEERDAQVPVAVLYICAAMLFLGATPLPYGYYTLLRLVACGVFAFAAFVAHERKNQVLPWLYGLIAVLFNPIFKIHLPKEAWVFVDIGAGVLLLVTAKTVRTHKKCPSH